MASQRSFSYGLVVGAIFFAIFVNQVSALAVEYCSSQNTAETQTNSSIYQSNGLCYNFCLDDWAFAILQVDDCWCSNEAPGTTTSVSDCNFQCHGYPNDLCGSSDGLFGYLALAKSPTATADGSSAAASSTSADQVTVTDTPSATTIFDTRTETRPRSSSPSTSSSSTLDTTSTTSTPAATTSSSSSTPISSSSTSTWTPTPVTSLETVTGQVKTVTVTPTVPPSSQSVTAISKKSGGGGLSTGAAVGLTVGLVALVALICSIIYFCWRRRQKEREQEVEALNNESSRRGSSAGLGGPIPSRTMSENSRYILGTDGRQVVETWEPDSRDAAGSRKSRLMPVDPRLDPFAPVYQRGENKSRESINTIRDDHDYSRRVVHQTPILRATNPDE